jgi:hypothetical protein
MPARGNNCQNESGTFKQPGGLLCNRGTAIYLTGPTVECADVDVLPAGNTKDDCDPADTIRTLNTEHEWSGYCVAWRYVTKDRKWVMVRDPRNMITGGWVFIRLSSLAKDRSSWPVYDTPGRSSCP